MSRMNKLSSYKTNIYHNKTTEIYYHSTCIVEFNQDQVTLKSGGWQTVTTKRKMNQASNQFHLGYSVFQKDHVWYVTLPSGETVDFQDGMTFKRSK